MVSGVGIGLRPKLWAELERAQHLPDWLELIPENYVAHSGWRRAQMLAARERWPLVAHGVSVSVGGPDPLDLPYLIQLKSLLDELGAEFYSDHLCWTRYGNHHYHDLLPLPFSEEAVRWTAARARRVSELLERPLLLENITYYAVMPGGFLTEGQFISAVLEESGAFLLLDLNNAYQNAINHGQLPDDVLAALPLERTRQIHLAGHELDETGVLLDRHATPVTDAVWSLYGAVTKQLGPIPTLIEWDNDIPPLARVLQEADRARLIQQECRQRGGHATAKIGRLHPAGGRDFFDPPARSLP